MSTKPECDVECIIMPSFPLLDVAIGLCFVYLLLSLICSSLNEGLESLLRNRANDLEVGVRTLLNDPTKHSWLLSVLPWKSSIHLGSITREFYFHPLIRNLFQHENQLPTYIPSRNFALALMDLLVPDRTLLTGATSGSPPALPDVPAFADQIGEADVPAGLKRSVAVLIAAAQGDVQQSRANIETWFNSTMDRVSGGYKRRTQYILFFIGLFLTVGVNADSIRVLRTLAHSKNLEAIVAAAGQTSNQPLSQGADFKSQVSQAMGTLQSLDVGIGWEPELTKEQKLAGRMVESERVPPAFFPNTCDKENASCQDPLGWLGYLIGLHWIGWLITAAAVTLGAPFWFDTLNRFIVVRSTVKPKEKSPEEASKDN